MLGSSTQTLFHPPPSISIYSLAAVPIGMSGAFSPAGVSVLGASFGCIGAVGAFEEGSVALELVISDPPPPPPLPTPLTYNYVKYSSWKPLQLAALAASATYLHIRMLMSLGYRHTKNKKAKKWPNFKTSVRAHYCPKRSLIFTILNFITSILILLWY